MTTPTRAGLDDLRTTLAREADSVESGHHTERVNAVRKRARVHRRRQAYAGALAAAVVVGGVGVAAVWQPARDVDPATELMGAEVPETMTSLGWTYALDPDSLATGDSEVEVSLDAARYPRLVSWVTRGSDDTVTVTDTVTETVTDDVPYVSSAGDFADFVLVPAGVEQTITVSLGSRGSLSPRQDDVAGLGLATYVLDESKPPAGEGEGARTFRRDVAGKTFLGASVGAPGEASTEVDLQLPDDPGATLSIAGFCTGLETAQVRYALSTDDGYVQRGSCARNDVFDPGHGGAIELQVGQDAGEAATLRVHVVRDGSPVADGDVPGLQVGVGAYAVTDHVVLEGNRYPRTVEVEGKVWEHVTSVDSPDAVQLKLRELMDVPLVASLSAKGGVDGVRTTLWADHLEIASVENGTGGVGTIGGIRVPHGTRDLVVRPDPCNYLGCAGVDWSAILVYRPVG